MPTPSERRALLFVAAVAALGTAVRGLRAIGHDAVPASDRSALAAQIARVDSAIAVGGRRPVRPSSADGDPRPSSRPSSAPSRPSSRDRPTAPDPLVALREAPLDLDRADSAALDILPGIGPALAARIVSDRATHGPFGSLEQLQRVRGVGPALAARIGPYVTFSSSGRPSSMGPSVRGPPPRP